MTNTPAIHHHEQVEEAKGAAHWVKKALASEKVMATVCIVGTCTSFAAAAMLRTWVSYIAAFGYIFLFGAALTYRRRDVMRKRRGWEASIVISLCVSAFTVVIGYVHGTTTTDLCGYFLLAIAMLTVVLMAQPVFDYGLLLFFLRLPLQIAATVLGASFSWWYVCTALLLVVGTVLQTYMLGIVNAMHEDVEKAVTTPAQVPPS